MTEREANIGKAEFIKKAFVFAIEENERLEDSWNFSSLEKLFWVLSHLQPKKVKRIIRQYSSFNYGRWILNQVFPRSENPEDFSSTETVTCLTDNPIQVLGWQDMEDLIQQGVDEEKLDRNWIGIGFDEEALKRRIDLEWSFFEEPRNFNAQSSVSAPQLARE